MVPEKRAKDTDIHSPPIKALENSQQEKLCGQTIRCMQTQLLISFLGALYLKYKRTMRDDQFPKEVFVWKRDTKKKIQRKQNMHANLRKTGR